MIFTYSRGESNKKEKYTLSDKDDVVIIYLVEFKPNSHNKKIDQLKKLIVSNLNGMNSRLRGQPIALNLVPNKFFITSFIVAEC